MNAYRDGEAEVQILAYDVVGGDWLPCGDDASVVRLGIDACWPALDRSQLWTSVVIRNEFHALLLLHWSLLPELVETGAVDASLSGMTVTG